ncbi:ATP-binding protein [Dankookia rubra]|nr:winged helix-turn-helix domain-containing protein [Dankookia rubra]
MTAASSGPSTAPVDFGPFRLVAQTRLLLKDGQPVLLGSRAFDLLRVLVGNARQPVSKRELMAKVWPDVVVDEGSLRFHIAALRKALGDGEGAARYIVTLPGRGYTFVGDVRLSDAAAASQRQAVDPSYILPARLGRLLGRDAVTRAVAARLVAERFVSLIGPGGIGKTTLAVSLGHEFLETFAGQVCMVDLGPVGDPGLAVGAVASALGIAVRTADASPAIIAFLRDRRLLLILDSCEHVIDSIAVLAEQIHRQAPGTHILATSREALRVEGERVVRLAALDSPPEDEALDAARALAFPAVQLFVERVAAGESAFELSDEEAPVVAGICRNLDGMPLAIELAAGRVGVYGIAETARLLDGSFPLVWRGRRTAHPRHQTLAATLDWSHALLLEPERLVLRRLAIFVGGFNLAAARAVAADDVRGGEMVLDSLAGLVAKSLVAVRSGGARTTYRLLDTTRAYALEKLAASGEWAAVARRHAGYFRDSLPLRSHGSAETARAGSIDRDNIGNVRAALAWCFGEGGDPRIGVDLAAAAAPLFLRLSLLTECLLWTERALAMLEADMRGARQEMELQASLGVSLMFTNGNGERVFAAFESSAAIAERIGDLERQHRLLVWLNILHLRMGRYRDALAHAERCAATALQLGDPDAIAAADGLVGSNYNLLGRHAEAELLLSASLARGIPADGPVRLGFSTRNHAMISLAQTLWLRGRPDRAVSVALETIEEAVQLGHPGTHCIALLYAVAVFLWAGDLARAEEHLEQFIAQAKRHSLAPYLASGMGIRGEIAIRRGQAEAGVVALRTALGTLQRDRYQMRVTPFCCAIAEGLVSLGRPEEALATIDGAIERAESVGDLMCMPEMLRIKGGILAGRPDTAPQAAEAMLLRSIELARAKDALSWELRGAMSLARLWSRQGRHRDAAQQLAAVHGRFTEGFATADLLAARLLLDELERRAAGMSWPAPRPGPVAPPDDAPPSDGHGDDRRMQDRAPD